MTADKWQTLIKETQLIGLENSTCCSEDFERAEREIGVKFPDGYQAFCNVFGSGMFGGFVEIYCPCSLNIGNFSLPVEGLKAELLWERERQAQGAPGTSDVKLDLVETLLSNAFVFGTDPNAHEILWDLGSYQDSDQSCDIYLIPSDDLEQTTLIGRDFYEFVRDFCLGSKAQKVLPPRINFYSELTGRNFYRFDEEFLKKRYP